MEKSDSWEGSPTLSNLDMDHFRIRKRKHMQTNAKKGRFFNICALQLCMVYLPFMLNQLRSLGVPLSLSHINTHLIIRHYTHKNVLYVYTFGHHLASLGQYPPGMLHGVSRNAGLSKALSRAWAQERIFSGGTPGLPQLRGWVEPTKRFSDRRTPGNNGPRSVQKVPKDQRHQINK